MLYVFTISFVLIMIGELADKSQLLALVLATRYKWWQVLIGITISTFTVHVASTALGQFAGGLVPDGVLPWVSGLLFVFFGLWTLRGDEIDKGEAESDAVKRFGVILTVAAAFFLAEVGDKTQIMTMAIAAEPGGALARFLRGAGPGVQHALGVAGLTPDAELGRTATFWAVTLGSTIGMVLVDAVAILVGGLLGKRLPKKVLTRVSGLVFIAFGVLTITLHVFGG